MLQLSVLHLLLERLTACSEARYRLRIGIFAYPTGIRHPHWGGGPIEILPCCWVQKTRMVWLPDGEKIWRYVYSFWHNPRTWQTDGRTPHDSIGRAYAQHCAAENEVQIFSKTHLMVSSSCFSAIFSFNALRRNSASAAFSSAASSLVTASWKSFGGTKGYKTRLINSTTSQ